MSKGTNSNNIANPDLTPQKLGAWLFRAVSRGAPIENIRNLIKHGADVNIAGNNGHTPLYWACLKNNPELVTFLIERGADVNIQNNYGEIPLHAACLSNNTKIGTFLIELGADVNIAGKHSKATALHVACSYNQTELAAVLMQHGAYVDIQDHRGQTPLHKACLYDYFQVAKLLIDAGANIHITDNQGLTPLRLACEYSPSALEMQYQLLMNSMGEIIIDSQIPKLLIQSGDDGHALLFLACQNGKFYVAKFLIRSGVEVDLSLLKLDNQVFSKILVL